MIVNQPLLSSTSSPNSKKHWSIKSISSLYSLGVIPEVHIKGVVEPLAQNRMVAGATPRLQLQRRVVPTGQFRNLREKAR